MKRLVVSLLRLGDILMMAPALRSLKKQHPEDELHILINENFAHVSTLLPYVDRVHLFPRKALQSDLGNPEAPVLAAFDKLDQYLRDLNQYKFSEVVNLTHTNLSACVTSLLNAESKFGLQMGDDNELFIKGKWLEVLNQPADTMPWHFSEIYLRAVGDEGFAAPEFPGEEPSSEPRLLIQPFTSEDRKKWSPRNWKLLLEHVLGSKEFSSCEVLAAPFEKKQAEDFIADLNLEGRKLSVRCCGLDEALQTLRASQLLLTVDTSIKHLAAGTRIPMIELALGGSEAAHTGAFREGVLVLSCTSDSPPEQSVLELVSAYLSGPNLAGVRDQFRCREWSAFLTRVTESGSWTLMPLSKNSESSAVDEIGKHMDIGFIQDEQGRQIGTSAFNCVQTLRTRLTPAQWRSLAQQLQVQERECETSLERIRGMGVHLRREASQSSVVDYSRFQTFSKCIGKLRRKQEYNRRFLRTVKLHIMEKP